MIYYETDYLMHHGVKGMKWGRRKQRQSQRNTKSKWSTKKKVAVGAAIVGGATLAALGGVAVYKLKSNNKALAFRKAHLEKAQRALMNETISQHKGMLDKMASQGAKSYSGGFENDFFKVDARLDERGNKSLNARWKK